MHSTIDYSDDNNWFSASQSFISVRLLWTSPCHPLSSVDSSLIFRAAARLCFIQDTISVEFFVSVLCDGSQLFQVPFELQIHSQSSIPTLCPHPISASSKQPTKVWSNSIHCACQRGTATWCSGGDDHGRGYWHREGQETLTYTMIPTRDGAQSESVLPLTRSLAPLTPLSSWIVRASRAHYFFSYRYWSWCTCPVSQCFLDHHCGWRQWPCPQIRPAGVQHWFPREPEHRVSCPHRSGPLIRTFWKNSEIRYSILNSASPNECLHDQPLVGRNIHHEEVGSWNSS